MAATYREKAMVGPALLAAAAVDLYTCPNDGSVVAAIVTNVQITNTDGSNASKVGVGIRRGGAAAATGNRIVSENGAGSLAPGGWFIQDKASWVLAPGEILYAIADVANRSTLTVNGLERLT